MRVVILGAGRVGLNIARYLATSENDVTLVDQSAPLLQKISDTLDVQPILGYASHPDVLERAGVADADLLIALTGSDEVNIVACEVTNTLFKVPKKIARIRNQTYLDPSLVNMFGTEKIAIDYVISPEAEVAKTICRSLMVMGAFDVKFLWNDEVQVIGIRCDHASVMLDTPLRLLPGQFPRLEFMVASIYREGILFIPKGTDSLQLNDDVYLVAHRNQIHEIMSHFHQEYNTGERVVIIGGGNIGLALALEMEKSLPQVSLKVIERDTERAEYIARLLRSTEILCGDGLDSEILAEANIQDCDTVVSVTEDDKVNILSSLLVKREGAQRAITLLNNMDYAALLTSLGTDAIVSPHAITVSTILQYVRQGQIHGVQSLRDGEVEIIEAEAQEISHVTGLTIQDISITGQILVGALYRDGQVIMYPQKIIIKVGDRLLMIVAKDAVSKVEQLFTQRPKYL